MNRAESGLSIVELLVAIIVIAIGLIGLGTLMRESGVVGRRGQERDIAIETAHKKMESIRDKSYYAIADESFSIPELNDGAGNITVTDVDPDSGWLKKVVVQVSWKKWGSSATMYDSLVTYVTRGGINP